MPVTEPLDYSTNDAVQATVQFANLLGLPLGLGQVHRSLIGIERSLLETSLAIDELVASGHLSESDGMVCLAGREELFDGYDSAAERAAETWPRATAWAGQIGRVPFVRMVAVAGALALDAVENIDAIDFFIIVRPRRLWITRLLIARVVRSAAKEGVELTSIYIATTRSPELTPQSVSMAWELTHLAAVVGRDVADTISRSNGWAGDLFPNARAEGNLKHSIDQAPSSKQKWTETVLLLPPFRLVENWARRRQIAALTAGGPQASADRFSTEVCDEHLGLRATEIDQGWRAATDHP